MARTTQSGPYSMREDLALVERMLDGDQESFEQFFRDSFGALFRFALSRLGGDEELAREIVQSTVLAAIESLESYRGEATLLTWMMSICRFQIHGHFRREGRSPPTVALVEETAEVRSVLESLAAGLEGPEEALRSKEVARLVHLTLDRLPARYGRVLEWKYFEGLPVKDIAERLEVAPKAAESVLSRAREAFRTGFAALCRGLGESGPGGLRLVRNG